MRLLDVMVRALSLGDDESVAGREVIYITKLLMDFSVPLTDSSDDSFEISKVFLSLREGVTPELWLKLKDGEELPFNSLPAGYLRLFSIVLDLGYRAYLLNGRYGKYEAKGMVLIDEVDLHLHPSLAIEVVDRFRRSFPYIQFIVTTHSPLVVTSLNAKDGHNRVFCLVKGKETPHELKDMFGIDYNAGLLDGMGVMPNNEDIDYVKRGVIRALRKENRELAEKKLRELKQIVSESRYGELLAEIKKATGNRYEMD